MSTENVILENQILRSSADLFLDEGISDIKINDVYKKAGIKKRDFTKHFCCKNSLLEKIISKCSREIAYQFRKIESNREESYEAKINCFVDEFIDIFENESSHQVIISSMNEIKNQSSKLATNLEEYFNWWRNCFISLLKLADDTVWPESIAELLLHHLIGAVTLASFYHDRSTLVILFNRMKSFLIKSRNGDDDMKDLKDIIDEELLEKAATGDMRAQLSVGMIALENGRLGSAHFFMQQVKKSLIE